MLLSIKRCSLVAAAVAGIVSAPFAVPSARAATVDFIPGTYDLAHSQGGTVVDTLTVSIDSVTHIADFSLTGADNLAFMIPNGISATGFNSAYGFGPYFSSPPYSTSSWNPAAYPNIVFYPASAGGGFSIGPTASEIGTSLVSLYGPGQIYSVTPLPATWSMMIAGLGVLAFAARKRARTQRPLGVVAPKAA